MIQGIIQMYTEAGVYQEEYPLSENYFNLEKYYSDNGIIYSLSTSPTQYNVVCNDASTLLATVDAKHEGKQIILGKQLVSSNLFV